MNKIRICHGEHEIELEGTDEFIKKQLKAFYDRMDAKHPAPALREKLLAPAPTKAGGKQPTPAEFYKSKGKNDGVSRILIFGKFLEDYRGQSEFSRSDINTVAKEAKLSKDVHPQYFTNAVRQGLLRKTGQRYSLTLSAEEVLASL